MLASVNTWPGLVQHVNPSAGSLVYGMHFAALMQKMLHDIHEWLM
jgi:hypothetical protein